MNIPTDLISKYTLDGKIKIENWYFKPETLSGKHYDEHYTTHAIKELEEKARRKGTHSYPGTDPWIHEAMEKYVSGKNVLVIGSTIPWYEIMALTYGCMSCTVVEYQQRNCEDKQLKYITVSEFEKELSSSSFNPPDIVLSIS